MPRKIYPEEWERITNPNTPVTVPLVLTRLMAGLRLQGVSEKIIANTVRWVTTGDPKYLPEDCRK